MLIRLLLVAAFGLAAITPNAVEAQTRRSSPPLQRRILPPAPLRVESRAQFEAELMRSEGGPLLAAIRRNFPAETPGFIDRLYRAYLDTARAPMEARAQAIGREQHAFNQSLLAYIRVAPDAALLEVIRAQLALYEFLQRSDVVTCGRLATQGNLGLGPSAMFRQMNGRAKVAFLDAAGAGRRTPVAPRDPVTAADREAIRAAIASLDPTGDLTPFFLADGPTAAASPELQCRYIVALARLPLTLPQASGVKVAIYMLERQTEAGPRGL